MLWRQRSQGSSSLYAIITWSVWLFLLAVMLWAANKSLAYGDEGFMLLSYKHPSESIASTTQFGLIGNRLFGWMHPGIVTLRLIRLTLDLGAVFVFVIGLRAWLVRLAPVAACRAWLRLSMLLPFIGIGALLGTVQTLSYDSLNDDALLVGYGLLLSAFASKHNRFGQETGAYLLVGLVMGLQFFVKFSSSILFLSAGVGTITLLYARANWRDTLRKIAVLLFGYGAGLAIFFSAFLDFPTWLAGFRAGLTALSGASHNPHALLGDDMVGLELLLGLLALQLLASGALFRIMSLLSETEKQSKFAGRLLLLMEIVICVALVVLSFIESVEPSSGEWGTSIGIATIIPTAIALLAIYAMITGIDAAGVIRRNRQTITISLFLFAAPFIGVIGSNVPILAAACKYLSFWLAIVALLLLTIPRVRWNRPIIATFWAIPLILAPAIVVQGLVMHSFEVPTTLFAQNDVLAQSGDLSGLNVDPASKRFFQSVRHLITRNSDFKPGDPIIAVYDMPALVYVLGGVSPGAPTFYPQDNEQQRNCIELRSSRLRSLSHSIIILRTQLQPSFKACLNSINIAFPERYRLAGAAKSPYDGNIVKVFVPKS